MRVWTIAAGCLVLIATMKAPQSPNSPLRRGDTLTLGELTFVAIPAGEFVMGDGSGRGLANERPGHPVRVDAFWMARTEVTFKHWKAFLDDSGHPAGRSRASGSDHPVVSITWEDARAYCAWFSRKHAVVARLPTEAEWEYAARGGLQGKQYPNGDSISPSDANYDGKGPIRVSSYPPNGYGLFDMAGNVFEWVADWYDPDYYRRSPRENPRGPAVDKGRPQRHADRGGGWCMGAAMTRVSARHAGPGNWDEGGTADCLGFRPVLETPASARKSQPLPKKVAGTFTVKVPATFLQANVTVGGAPDRTSTLLGEIPLAIPARRSTVTGSALPDESPPAPTACRTARA